MFHGEAEWSEVESQEWYVMGKDNFLRMVCSAGVG